MLFAIHAFENQYGGFHGMEQYAVVEVMSEEEAKEIATEMSAEVIDNYNEIYDAFVEEAEDNGIEEDTEEWYNFIDECIAEDIDYEYWKVKDETTKTLEELNEMFYNNPDEFVDTFCEDC